MTTTDTRTKGIKKGTYKSSYFIREPHIPSSDMILCQRNIPQNGGILCPEVPLDDFYSNLLILFPTADDSKSTC
jgi:hypothetical protein